MIKPILYHSFKEKEIIEKELMSKIPLQERLSKSKALMDIFFQAGKKSRRIKASKAKK